MCMIFQYCHKRAPLLSIYLWTSSINSGSKWSMQVKNMNLWMPNTGNHVNKMPTTVMLCGHIAFTIVYRLCESGIIWGMFLGEL
jgi:hypothetical protein